MRPPPHQRGDNNRDTSKLTPSYTTFTLLNIYIYTKSNFVSLWNKLLQRFIEHSFVVGEMCVFFPKLYDKWFCFLKLTYQYFWKSLKMHLSSYSGKTTRPRFDFQKICTYQHILGEYSIDKFSNKRLWIKEQSSRLFARERESTRPIDFTNLLWNSSAESTLDKTCKTVDVYNTE